MDKQTLNEYRPDYAVSPGEVLELELETRGMKQQELAKRDRAHAKAYRCLGQR